MRRVCAVDPVRRSIKRNNRMEKGQISNGVKILMVARVRGDKFERVRR